MKTTIIHNNSPLGNSTLTTTFRLKPILSLTSTTMGNILVVRSPFRRQWLFNISITNKGLNMKPFIFLALIPIVLLLTACEGPTEPVTHYHYIHEVDTTYADEPFENGIAYLAVDPDTEWTSASVVIYQDSTHWSLGSVTLAKPNATSPKPVVWDGDYIKVPLDRIPANWTKMVITFSRKEVI